MSIKNIQELNVGLNGAVGFKPIVIKQYDKNTRRIEITLLEGSDIYEIPTGAVAKFQATKPDNTIIFDDCVIENGIIVYKATEGLSACAGIVKCEVGLYNSVGDELLQSSTFDILVEKSAMDRNALESSNEFNTLTIMINTITDIVERAETILIEIDEVVNNATTVTKSITEAEKLRVTAENTRVSAENTRISNENTRKSQETSRVSAESSRVIAETDRNNSEITRKSQESTRVSQETTRQSQETTRVAQETARQNYYTAYKVCEAYSSTKAYIVGNKVTYQGSTYQNIVGSTGIVPTNTTNWVLIAAKGVDGAGGDMFKNYYDPQNKSQDIFAYVDNHYNDVNTSLANQIATANGASINLPNSFNGGLQLKELQGKSVQNGVPSSDAKADIVSVGDDGSVVVGVCGKNVLKTVGGNGTVNGITFIKNSDGTFTANGTATSLAILDLGAYRNTTTEPKFLSGGPKNGSNSTYKLQLFNNESIFVNDLGSGGLMTTLGEYRIRLVVYAGTTVNNLTFKPQLEPGSTATTYEQYKEQLVTIPLTQPLRSVGSVYDRGCVKIGGLWGNERKFGIAIFDGSDDEGWEAWATGDGTAYRYMSTALVASILRPILPSIAGSIISDRYVTRSANETHTKAVGISVEVGGRIGIYDSSYNTNNTSLFKARLKTNPITVVYELATSTFEPYSQSLQDTLNKLQSNQGVTNVFTTDALQPNMIVEYGKTDTSALSIYANNIYDSKVDKSKVTKSLAVTESGFIADAEAIKTINDKADANTKAIGEVNNNLTDKIGNLSSLTTTSKTDLVGAVNEVHNNFNNYKTKNVKNFGAIGDGISDDSNAIQACINSIASSGGTVYFPSGIYLITRNIDIILDLKTDYNEKGISIEGESKSSTIILNGGSDSQYVFSIKETAIDGELIHSYFGLKNITFTGKSDGLKHHGIYMYGIVYPTISDVAFTRLNMAFRALDVCAIRFVCCEFVGCSYGMWFDPQNHATDANAIEITNCFFYGNGMFAAYFNGGCNINFHGGTVEVTGFNHGDQPTSGIRLVNCGRYGGVACNINDVYFEGNGNVSDIWITNKDYDTITNIKGCTFNKFASPNNNTSNVYAESNGNKKNIVNISGCAFEDRGNIPSADTKYISIFGENSVLNTFGNYYQSDLEAPSV